MVSRTGIVVERRGDRCRTRLTGGVLRPQLLPDRVADRGQPPVCRIGLVATTALLLGGDEVELSVEVGPGAALDLFDVAGTVAYSGRGAPASWTVRVWVAAGARLRYAGQPLVVADGADLTRTTSVDQEPGSRVLLRDTLVLGRTGERGGRLRTRSRLSVAGRDVWREDQVLDPDGDLARTRPGLLGDRRVLDSVLLVGHPPVRPAPAAVLLTLPGPAAQLARYLGTDLAASPLADLWSALPAG